jgi:hypothetical protein
VGDQRGWSDLGVTTPCAADTVCHHLLPSARPPARQRPKCPASCWPDELPAWPVTWIRDSGGSWHTTRTLGRGGTGQAPLRVELVPPLSRTATWIETITTGQSAQIRARLPLRWQ